MLKVLYAGSPDAAAAVLKCLAAREEGGGQDGGGAQYKIVGVLTNPPSAHGRHKVLIPTPAATAATELGIRVFTPEHLDAAFREEISPLAADILVCFAYGHIFGPKFLSLFPLGGVNLHPSLLPRYRGPAPVPAAILHRDSETAVTVQRLSLGMDEGNILAQEKIPLFGTETAKSLLERCAQRGAALLTALLEAAAKTHSLPEGTPQSGDASYTKIITKGDAQIDWQMGSTEIDAHIRAYTPEPGAWTVYKGETLRILKAHAAGCTKDAPPSALPGTILCHKKGAGIMVQTGSGVLAVTVLQRQGKKAMDAASFMNGERDAVGSVLG